MLSLPSPFLLPPPSLLHSVLQCYVVWFRGHCALVWCAVVCGVWCAVVCGGQVMRVFGATGCQMHACGREDIDVRCLGKGEREDRAKEEEEEGLLGRGSRFRQSPQIRFLTR